MDDDVPVLGPGTGEQPVTRRQLRLAAQAAERERALEQEREAARRAAPDPSAPEPSTPDPSTLEPSAAEQSVSEHTGPAPGAPELPPVVPEEPEVDDVRWDGPPVPTTPSAHPDAEAVAGPSANGRGAAWSPLPADVENTRPVPRFPAATGEAEAVAPSRPAGTWPGPRPADVAPPASPFGGPLTAAEPAPPVPADHVPGDPAAMDTAAMDTAPPHAAEPVERDGVARTPVLHTSPAQPGEELPTLDDLLARRGRPQAGPAELGWRATVRRLTGGLVRLGPGPAEQRRREDVADVRRELDGPRTIVVVNPKGGAHKTTATLLLAATFGTYRGGYTLAWDNNETRGTMGWRSQHAGHTRTAVDLLENLGRFEDPNLVRVGDLDAFVRAQPARFDVLASDEDAASAASIDADAFRALHGMLSRFYRVMVVDTGNNMRASNWQAALDVADQVVLVTTVREDTAQSAAWAADALRATGREDLVRNAVTVLADPAVERDRALGDRLHDHFGRLTRAVVDVPYDPALVAGGPLDVDELAPRTLEAWLRVTATVARGL